MSDNTEITTGPETTGGLHQEEKTANGINPSENLEHSYRFIAGILLSELHTGKIVSANNRAADLLGYSMEELEEKTFFEITHSDDQKDGTESIRRLSAQEIPLYTAEQRLIRKDGSGVWTIVSMELLHNGDGVPYCIAASIVDITDRKKMENALRESEESMRLMIESAKDYAIFLIDQDRHVLTWNHGAKEIFGYTDEEILGRRNDILFSPEDIANGVPAKEVETACKTGRAYDDRWHLRKDGSRFFASGVVAPLTLQGDTTKLVKIARDITERIQQEELLKTADRHKTEFLATLAHELRNPLASIQYGMEVLRREKGEKERQEAQETVERQLQQIIHLVNDLLDISRIDQGKIKLEKRNVNLIDAINLALETTRPIINGYRHQLTVTTPPRPIIVEGDVARLSQIFLNILVNAAKYTNPGGRISLTATTESQQAVVVVRDNGLGIPRQMLSKIFEMFEQVQNRDEYPQAGLGIGLSVVKQLVEMHGGRVEVNSEGPMKGSEFVVRLPLAKTGEVAVRPGEPADAHAAGDVNKRVLIVDDNSDAADLMGILLHKKGYQVRKAYDGKSAISAAAAFDPEIVLLDIGLPDINGYEVAKVLREKLGNRLLIAVSGWGQEEDIVRSKGAGFDHHVVKPVDMATIEKLLSSSI